MPHERTTSSTRPAPGSTIGYGAACACCASRRQVLRAAGAAALVPAGSLALAGCGQGSTSASEPTVGADGTVTVPADDTPVGGSTYYPDAKIVVTHPAEGDYRAFDATCPHQGCATSGSDDGVLVCPCHGSQFDAATGDVVQGPAETGLTALTATLDGGDLQIRG
jgi:Rieske Fe-S protein